MSAVVVAVAGAQNQVLVLYCAVAVFMTFLSGSVAMDRGPAGRPRGLTSRCGTMGGG